jgi:hypothetical protein
VKNKRLTAAWNEDYLLEVLAGPRCRQPEIAEFLSPDPKNSPRTVEILQRHSAISQTRFGRAGAADCAGQWHTGEPGRPKAWPEVTKTKREETRSPPINPIL